MNKTEKQNEQKKSLKTFNILVHTVNRHTATCNNKKRHKT